MENELQLIAEQIKNIIQEARTNIVKEVNSAI
jgi:hypothetical protein